MKIYVGIDIAKLNHFAAAISSDGEIIIEPFKFTNDAEDVYKRQILPLQELIALLKRCMYLISRLQIASGYLRIRTEELFSGNF